MHETDPLGLELLRPHRGNQLGASARGENECDVPAGARVAARGRDEIRKHCVTLASGNPTAVIRIFAPGGRRAIRRICDDQVEARGLHACDFLVPNVGANYTH